MIMSILGVLTVALVIVSLLAVHEPTYAKTENKRQNVVLNDSFDDNMWVIILDKHKAIKLNRNQLVFHYLYDIFYVSFQNL